MLSEEELDKSTELTSKDLRKALAAAKGNAKELIDAEVVFDDKKVK